MKLLKQTAYNKGENNTDYRCIGTKHTQNEHIKQFKEEKNVNDTLPKIRPI